MPALVIFATFISNSAESFYITSLNPCGLFYILFASFKYFMLITRFLTIRWKAKKAIHITGRSVNDIF